MKNKQKEIHIQILYLWAKRSTQTEVRLIRLCVMAEDCACLGLRGEREKKQLCLLFGVDKSECILLVICKTLPSFLYSLKIGVLTLGGIESSCL